MMFSRPSAPADPRVVPFVRPRAIADSRGVRWERIDREVADPEVRRTVFERILRSGLLDVIRRDGAQAADVRLDGMLTGLDSAARHSA